MLEVLAERQVSVPELGTFTARSSPWVILTSNDTRELSPALKRRCLHFQVGYPDPETERAIVAVRAPDIEEEVVGAVAPPSGAGRAPHTAPHAAGEGGDPARRLRDLPLRKSPSIAEVIDAARAASYLKTTGNRPQVGSEPAPADAALLSLLVKFGTDLDLARRVLSPPAADTAAARTGEVGEARGATPQGSVTARAFGAGRARSAGVHAGR